MPQSQISNDLKQLKVDVEDTSTLSSTYFLISNFTATFGLGKNAITINNPTKDIRVEAYDLDGNVLYAERAIDNDTVNKKQILTVSFHVYSKNSTGIGKLYIVGTFANKLVRYSTNITINVTVLNTSKVAFYTTPTIEVTPLLTFVAKTNISDANPKIITGSFFSKAGYPIVNFNVDDNRYNKLYTDYQLTTTNSNFSSSFSNFYAKLYVEKIRSPVTGQEQIVNDTSSILIKNVINAKTLQLDSPYIYKNTANNKNTVTEIIQGKYEILYSEYEYNPVYFTTASYLTESVDFAGNTRYKKSSIAEITYKNIDTFSGTVVRHKLYRRSLNVPEDYTTIVDETFVQNEYLKNSIIPIKSYQNLGNFYSQFFIDKFWLTSSNSFNLIASSDYYINGVNITGSSINDGYIITKLNTSDAYRNSTYIPYNENEYLNQSGSSYDCNFIKLLGKTNYILSFNCNLLKKNINDMMELSFYLIGSYENNKKEAIYNQTYGVLLANIQVKDSIISKNFNNTLKFKFTPLNDIYGTLVVVPRGFDSVILNNISLQQDKVDGYSYNSYTIRVPFRVDQPNELYDIKAELYDAGANLVYSNLRTIQSFDPSGSSSPINSFNTTTLSVGVLNVSSETNITGSINVDNFGCVPETNINNVNYVVTWDNINKNLCVATSSLFISSSGGGGSGLVTGSTYPITSSWSINASSASYVTASNVIGTVTSASYALTASYAPTNTNITASWSINSLTASSLVAANSYTITNLTASNISASGNISASTIWALNGSFTQLSSSGPIYISGSNAYIQLLPVGATTIPTNTTASYIYCSGSTNDLYFTQYNGPFTNTTRLRWLESNMYTGILYGGQLSSTVGSTTFNVKSGSGLIVSMNATTGSDPYPIIKQVSWNDYTNIPIINSASAKITYVGIDNIGAIVQQTNGWGSTDIDQWDEQIELGVVLHLSGSVSSGVFNSPQVSYGYPQKMDDFTRAFGPLKISGHTLRASGSGLSIQKTGGVSFREGANYYINPNHPSTVIENAITASKIYYYYMSGSTPIINTGVGNAGYTTLDITHYNNNGVLTALQGSFNKQWTLQRVFWVPNSPTNAFIVYYGNAVYTTLIDAVAAVNTEAFTEADNTALNAIQLATIVIEGNSTNLTTTNKCTIVQAGLFRSVGGVGSGGTNPVVTSLDSLSDVAINSPIQGDLLIYGNGTQWNNGKSLSGSYSLTGSLFSTETISASSISGSVFGTSSWAINSLTASSLIAGNSYTITNLTASNISSSTITSSDALIAGNLTVNGSIFASVFSASVIYITSSEIIVGDNIITLNASTPYKRYAGIEVYDSGSGTLSSFLLDGQNDYFFLTSSNVNGKIITGPDGQLNLTTNKIPKAIGDSSLIDSNISDDGTTVNINNNIYASQNSITQSVSGVQVSTLVTQSSITSQNGSSSFVLNGRLSSSNVNVGIPNSSYPWGTAPLTGSYFSTWNSNTNVSDILRFFAGAFSSSYPIPTPNTKTFSGITGTNTNFGSTVTINGRIPSGSTNANILYLQPLGWATIGSTIFSGFTFNTGAAYISYASTVGGSTTVSSSLGSSAFGLGFLTSGNLTQVNLSGSFRLTFASSSAGTVNYTNTSASIIISQSVTNLTPSIAVPIALNTVPSANISVIPPVYQDGYFSNFTGSNLTNSISLSNISSSGIYVFSASIGINSGSSAYTSYSSSGVTYYYTPLTDASFTQSIASPNSSASYISAVTRSLSGAPYLTSGSSYRYVVTSSGAFNPLYVNGTVSSVTFANSTLGLTTINSSSLITNPTIQTAGVVKSSDYTTTRVVGTHPFESDVIVFDLTLIAAGTGSNAASSASSFSTFTVSTTTNNRAGSPTVVGSQTYNIHITGSFGIPSASGSLLYFGRPAGFVTSSLTFGSQSLNPGAITEQLLDEGNRIILANNMLNMSGSAFNSSSLLGTNELQVKPGFLVNPGGSNGYWYPSGYGTTYKYYVRRFKSNLVVNKLQITLTGNTSLVNWDSTSSNTVAMAILFESANTNVYARCRLYDVNNLSNNVVSSSVTPSNFTTSGVNPFGSNIDLYGNNGTGASNASGIFIFPTRAADGAILDNTNTAQDEFYLLIRYNGSPTPITSIRIEKLS